MITCFSYTGSFEISDFTAAISRVNTASLWRQTDETILIIRFDDKSKRKFEGHTSNINKKRNHFSSRGRNLGSYSQLGRRDVPIKVDETGFEA